MFIVTKRPEILKAQQQIFEKQGFEKYCLFNKAYQLSAL